MNKYYIQGNDGTFWCEWNGGFWSKFEQSLKYRFEGILIWVLSLYMMMRTCGVKCKLVKISHGVVKWK
jgi:hypothetical protein